MIEYTIAILPASEISKTIESFFKDYSIYRHSTLPPHLTVTPPFTVTDLNNENFLNLLIASVAGTQSFEIDLEKVDTFRGRNNVIYLAPSPASNRKIFALAEKLKSSLESHITRSTTLEKSLDTPFQSHLTLAKHVPKQKLYDVVSQAKKRFSPSKFECQKLSLFKNSGQGWKFVTDIKF